MQEDVKQ